MEKFYFYVNQSYQLQFSLSLMFLSAYWIRGIMGSQNELGRSTLCSIFFFQKNLYSVGINYSLNVWLSLPVKSFGPGVFSQGKVVFFYTTSQFNRFRQVHRFFLSELMQLVFLKKCTHFISVVIFIDIKLFIAFTCYLQNIVPDIDNLVILSFHLYISLVRGLSTLLKELAFQLH